MRNIHALTTEFLPRIRQLATLPKSRHMQTTGCTPSRKFIAAKNKLTHPRPFTHQLHHVFLSPLLPQHVVQRGRAPPYLFASKSEYCLVWSQVRSSGIPKMLFFQTISWTRAQKFFRQDANYTTRKGNEFHH